MENGYRAIAYDRRGFGKSSQLLGNYYYSTLAINLRDLVLHLDLKEVTFACISLWGDEVVCYFTDFARDRVKKVALIPYIIPLVAQKEDNSEGVQKVTLRHLTSLKLNRISEGVWREFLQFPSYGRSDIPGRSRLWFFQLLSMLHGSLPSKLPKLELVRISKRYSEK